MTECFRTDPSVIPALASAQLIGKIALARSGFVASRLRPGVRLFTSALRRERAESADFPPDNDNVPSIEITAPPSFAVVERFRQITVYLVLASTLLATVLAIAFRTRVDLRGTVAVDWVLAALLLASRMWWERIGQQRVADAAGAVALVALGGMTCGAIALLELRFHFPIADQLLRTWDYAIGLDGLRIVEAILRAGHWIFLLMAPAYNFTVPIFFVSLLLLSLRGERVEAWRAALCFVGTLLTVCLIAVFFPAKGLGTWASPELLDRLPPQSMRSFWLHFDQFYFGADPVFQVQLIDGVISFPSFHAVMGFLVVAMWRKHVASLLASSLWFSFMLLATFPGGGHYVVDLLAGFAVWAAWFALSRQMEARTIRGAPH